MRIRFLHLLLLASGCFLISGSPLAAQEEGGRLVAQLPNFHPGPPLRGSLHSVGADSMDVMTFRWIQLFREAQPGLRVTIEARSSITAAPALTNGLADVAPIARELLPSELAMFHDRFGYDPLLVPVASGSYATENRSHALAVYVHRDNPIRELTLAQLDAIFSISRNRGHPRDIAVWGDLGLKGEWAARPIRQYAMRRPNGIVNFFQHRVLLDGDFKPSIRERSNSTDEGALSAVVDSIAADPGGIGYAGFAHASPDVRALALAEGEGKPFVRGTPETIADRTYPLARFIYIAVNKEPGQPLAPKVKEFLRLVLSQEGQRIVGQDGDFLPLPVGFALAELARLDADSRTHFAGDDAAAPAGARSDGRQ